MSKTGYITARVEPKLKESAGRVLARIGVSTSDAITMFLRQVVMRQGMPFDVAVPNARTRKAIEELETPAKRGKLKRPAHLKPPPARRPRARTARPPAKAACAT